MKSILITSALFLAALSPFGTRPIVDFDLIYDELLPYGTWTKDAQHDYSFIPKATSEGWRPYRHGQWVYTDYGWTWKGHDPCSWATDHYGFWTKNKKQWAWIGGTQWNPATVEWLASGTFVGWRPTLVDAFGNPLEPESVRYGTPSEWNFIPREKLLETLKDKDFVPDEDTGRLLRTAVPIDHIFVTYREIGRPGPEPSHLILEDGTTQETPVVTGIPTHYYEPEKKDQSKFFIYRPKFHQDSDGIKKRIALRTNPPKKPHEALETLVPKKTPEQLAKEQEMIRREQRRREREEKYFESLYE